MKMKFWACVVVLLLQISWVIKTQLSYKGKKEEKENLVKEINSYYDTSHIGRTCRKSSKISQCWIWTGLTDSAQIWLDQLKIGSKLSGLP